MGDHFVPQHYLQGFTDPAGKIWVYSREDGQAFESQPKSIANENYLYGEALEERLTNEIEAPANRVLDLIWAGSAITADDRLCFAHYMVAMIKRNPRVRDRGKELARSVKDRISMQFAEELEDMSASDPSAAETSEQRQKLVNDALSKLANERYPDMWRSIVMSESSPRLVNAITAMNWVFCRHQSRPVFITCDNPMFYFTSLGLGNPQCEITFPISSHIALWATWRPYPRIDYPDVSMRLVKELNRRIVVNSYRQIYHAQRETWLPRFVTDKRRLNLIH